MEEEPAEIFNLSFDNRTSPPNVDVQSTPAQVKSKTNLVQETNKHLENEKTKEKEDDDDEDLEDEEVSEPPFKYIRILNDLTKIFAGQDAASCFAVHCKYLVVGTQWGCVYVLDHAGNIIPKKVVRPHNAAVNQLSIDNAGEFIASCANDGKVAVYGLCDGQLGQVVVMDRPVRAVAIDPEYAVKTSSRRFVTGDRNLIVHERGFLTKHKQYDVFAGKERDGYIHVIAWRGAYIAFANDTGVRVYDKSSEMMITHVERRQDLTLRCELYPARISWYDDRNFVIGWANTVTVCSIKDATCVAPDMRNKMVEIRYLWDVPHRYVTGVAFAAGGLKSTPASSSASGRGSIDFTTWHELVLFCVCRQNSDDVTSTEEKIRKSLDSETEAAEEELERPSFPRVLLVEPVTFNTFFIVSEDIIEMRDSEKLLCTNFHMAALGEDDMYFLLCNKDMIQVRPSNDDDHVEWLLSNYQYERALIFAKDRRERLKKYDAHSVATDFLRHLLHEGRYEEAAKLCIEVCGRRKDLWEEYVTTFERHRQLKKLAPHLPTHDPQLEAECYHSVLLDFLDDDVITFKKYVTEWSPDLYRAGAMIIETLKRLYTPVGGTGDNLPLCLTPTVAKNSEVEHRILLTALAQLYTYERKYERAFAIYLTLEDKYVFHLIDRYQLFPLAKEKIQKLMTIDTELAVRVLLENEESVSSQTVMTQLSRQPRLQLAYLDRLFARGAGAEFADLAVTLYAEYDRQRLLPFLRNNEYYRLDKALDICRQRGERELVPEIVFLLGRGGNRKEALRVIINESRDINQAVEFCKEHDDRDLWKDLIDYSVQRPEFVTTLMRQIGTHVDPAMLIRKIPAKSVIPRLRESLVKLLDDYSLQIDLQDGCRRVTIGDCHENFQRFVRSERRGVRIEPHKALCLLCSCALLEAPRATSAVGTGTEVACFRCQHCYHVKCLLEKGIASCFTCASGRAASSLG